MRIAKLKTTYTFYIENALPEINEIGINETGIQVPVWLIGQSQHLYVIMMPNSNHDQLFNSELQSKHC